MYELIRKIHMYTGLVNFTVLFVFGVTGLLGTLATRPFQWNRPEPVTGYVDFTPPAGLTDKELADRVYEQLRLPMAGPVPPVVKRNRDHDVEMTFYTPNGMRQVTVLEKENRVRVVKHGLNAFQYLSTLHETTIRNASSDLRVRLWAWYNEAAIWSLIGMALSGVYLWLATRPRYRWAQAAFTAGTGLFAALWIALR